MKQTLLSLLLLLATLCQAQDKYDQLVEREQRIFKGALTLGLNMAQVDGDTYGGYQKLGLHTGGAVSIRLGKKFNISTELLYSQKGARGAHVFESFSVGSYFEKYYLDLNYIDLPVVLQYKHTQLWGFEAGLCYSRLMGYKEEGFGYMPAYILPEVNYFNSADISYLFGAYFFCTPHWVANARYQYSAITIRPWQRVPELYYMGRNQFSNVITLRMLYIL